MLSKRVTTSDASMAWEERGTIAMTVGPKEQEEMGYAFTAESSRFAKIATVPAYVRTADSVQGARNAKVLRYVSTAK